MEAIEDTMNLARELDGKYRINTMTNYEGPLKKRSDGQTEIKDGKTFRIDNAGCEWRSSFEWLDEEKTKVKMTSVADPSNAANDFLLLRPDGTPTSDAVTYTSELKVMRKGERVQMTGTINYGAETVILTMQRIDAV